MTLKEAQDRSFELLCLIDDICRKEGITYFLDGGTEIAAVREKDLIPWDDDIDIQLRLEDYPAFRRAMEEQLPDYCRVQEPGEFAPAFYDFLVRVIDTRYFLRAETDEDRYYRNLQNHLGIDVFLHFSVPEGLPGRLLAFLRLRTLYGLGMAHRYRPDYGKYSIPVRAAVTCLRTIGKPFSARYIYRRMNALIQRLNRRPSGIRLSTYLTWSQQHKSEWTREAVYGEIRGRAFPVPAGYDSELTMYYGDYMNPPEDLRKFNWHLEEKERYRGEGPAGPEKRNPQDVVDTDSL